MSFAIHTTTTPTTAGRIRQAIIDEYLLSADEHAHAAGVAAETCDLVDAGADVANRLVASLGPGWAEASVTVSGHANSEHKARAGWANDQVSVSVSVRTYAE